jgi:cellulose synthase/poly-beta-1,6-N-acetylglucosamine synthase-like glycosyltransferase
MILYFLKLNNPKDKVNISIKMKNKGFLNISTIHKSKYSYYNYTDNILIYKDLYNNISYIPINQTNAIKASTKISKEIYFQFCENKILLDNTKYKRNIKPKISVIIPYYNKDKFSLYIPLRSIQNQSFKDIEIIFVDDGSSEKKINEIIKEMKNDNRIILLKHKTRKGILMSRIDGIRYSSGEYIIQLDQDDLYINI